MIGNLDLKSLRNNEYRESKVRGKFMVSIRVPGSIFPAKLLPIVQEIAEKYGSGKIHMQTRQKLSIPDILYKDVNAVNKLLAPIIEELEVNICGIELPTVDEGYATIGARNIMNCIGSYHCTFANVDTISLARKLEKDIYPNDYHIKIAVSGCPNDCSKANFSDFGIMGISKIDYNYDRCIGCGACVRECKQHVTSALYGENGKAAKQVDKCIGCGGCVKVCPTMAWSRNNKKYYWVKIGGRTGKQTPRAGKTMFMWITEEPLRQIVRNIFMFQDYVLDGKPIYRHFGHLIDESSYKVFRDFIMGNSKKAEELQVPKVILNDEALVADRIYWDEDESVARIHLKNY
ncbi:sulfite reductase subunit C [Clostridium paraputrificum]|uniref:sulfite reductase subunit C n=1 Tax=Clostridium TaxID=1485 RepID=UPI003D3351A9